MTTQPDSRPNPQAPPPDAPELVVGIGASAGGIAALTRFFEHAPVDAPVAYVVILHLSPDHESKLAEVLQRTTALPVTQVRDTMPLQPRHVYVIPPNRSLRAVGDTLAVSADMRIEERKAPIDIFFRTLANVYQARAAAVVLSGTGSDGSMGLKRVKELGGLTVAQKPDEAEHAEMPLHAIATTLVDYVLPAERIPQRIVDYFRHLRSSPVQRAADPAHTEEDGAVREVLRVVRSRTSHDFSDYKPATIRRRIARRMSLHDLENLSAYAAFIKRDAGEPAALMKDLLISVTNFFRDAPAWHALDQLVVPRLFADRDATDHVRVWSAGCATGEEAYSLAMLLTEHAAGLLAVPRIQIFATDLDHTAIQTARDGLYSEADVADVSPARLQRFFNRESAGYRVRRELRELVLFAHHNVVKDPPFSHLDLVVCRNLLIYLNRASQQRVLETFQFALRREGYLFLGGSETADERHELFQPIDTAAHIYQVRTTAPRPHLSTFDVRPAPMLPPAPDPRPPDHIAPSDLHLRLLEELAAPSVIVTDEYTVVHMSATVSAFMQVPGGEPTRDLLKLVRAELRADVRNALLIASQERSPAVVRGARLSRSGSDVIVSIHVRPVLRAGSPPRGYYLVLFEEEAAAPRVEARIELITNANGESEQLHSELARVNEQLRLSLERSAVQVEEAKAANEELQAMNEELRSSTEELETSKEELQSSNEELATVNQELKIKIEELATTNNDFQNLITSTEMGAIFLDRALRVKLSTPRAQQLFSLQPGDVGRELSDITNRLLYDNLYVDLAAVLRDLQTIEREVETRDAAWYSVRIHPYRTAEDRIEGVAITFQDITTRKRAEADLRAGDERAKELEARITQRTDELEAEVARRGAQEQVMILLRKLVTAQEDERARIARDLHDQLGQQLTALRLALERHRESLPTPGAEPHLESALTLARQVDDAVDFLAWELRPAVLDDLGLAAALPRFLDEWSAFYRIPSNFQITGALKTRLPPEVEIAFYRVAQEALTNVTKHAHASRVDVVLEADVDVVQLIVEDDGVGFDAAAAGGASTGIGVMGMRERSALIGAALQIESQPGRGTTIYLRYPLVPPPTVPAP